MELTIYHNPRCSKSRATLALLESRGESPRVIDYLNAPPDAEELAGVLKLLGKPVLEMVRQNEDAWAESGLDSEANESDVLAAIANAPILLQRPIVVRGKRAVIGRPPENIEQLFD